MVKEDKDQRVEAIKALTLDLEKIKLEQASLIQRYNELSNDYANATNSITRAASLEKEIKCSKLKLRSSPVSM